MNLKDLRKKIDDTDKKIILLLKRRFSVVKKIGNTKQKLNLPIEDKKREEIIMRKQILLSKKIGLNTDLVAKILKLLIEESKTIQKL